MNKRFGFSRRAKWMALIISGLLIFGIVGVALAATNITIGVNPGLPQAIKIGSGVENYNWNMTFTSVPAYYVVHVVLPGTPDTVKKCQVFVNTNSQTYIFGDITNLRIDANLPGCNSSLGANYSRTDIAGISGPVSGSSTWAPPLGSPEGNYQVHVDYYSDSLGVLGQPESSAYTTFWIADGIGNIQLFKFGDTNANGVQDGGEVGLANWQITYRPPVVFGGFYTEFTGASGITTVLNVPAGSYLFAETLQPGWSRISPTTTPYALAVSDGLTTTATFGNAHSLMACTSLTDTAPLPVYHTNDVITYTVSYTKTGTDSGAPVADLYFAPAILARDSDTSGVTPTGSGTLASPYHWVLPPTAATSGSFSVILHFTANPASSLVGTTRVLNGTTGSTNCTNSLPFGPNAVTLTSLQAQPVAASPVLPLALVGGSAAILAGTVFITRRNRKHSM